jgi:uroporphyrinogen-III synthase
VKPVLILRPEPGNGATAARARAIGLVPVQRPLFAVGPLPWSAPDPAEFDGLLLTSANALRHGGAELARLRTLDVFAVGEATAEAARGAGFRVAMTGAGGVDALLAALPGQRRLLHLTGVDHRRAHSRHLVMAQAVYLAAPLAPDIPTGEVVALVHSPRAGARFADRVRDRSAIAIAAISAAAARACGAGWGSLNWVDLPSDSDLLALGARLCQG